VDFAIDHGLVEEKDQERVKGSVEVSLCDKEKELCQPEAKELQASDAKSSSSIHPS